ncbi:MAG TPA: helix-turn-helix domain-containing protein [Solirubrobacterales bacterium]|nr:helix-turn-helix domain-containing protein [Solirubrobacterales bacterium]
MARHRVVAVPLAGVRALDLAAPAHFFGHLGKARYDFALAAAAPGAVRTSSGFELLVEAGPEAIAAAETVVIPGYSRPEQPPPEEILDALRTAAGRGARTVAICTGAFALAHAGLLDGRRATTHWEAAEALAASFPQVEVDPDVLFVDEGRVLTSAGVAAGIDLCLHIVRRDHGAELATAFARRTVVAPHRDGGQAQFIDLPLPPTTEAGAADLAATRAWALEHLADPLDVAALARHAVVSPRTFARRFRAETGTTPHKWLLDQRILHARRLLESSDSSIEEVASRCGFGSAASLRDHFKRRTGTSPIAYRRTFSALEPIAAA